MTKEHNPSNEALSAQTYSWAEMEGIFQNFETRTDFEKMKILASLSHGRSIPAKDTDEPERFIELLKDLFHKTDSKNVRYWIAIHLALRSIQVLPESILNSLLFPVQSIKGADFFNDFFFGDKTLILDSLKASLTVGSDAKHAIPPSMRSRVLDNLLEISDFAANHSEPEVRTFAQELQSSFRP